METEQGFGVACKREALDNFWKFIYERHLIWHKRFVLELPPPWTTDPVIRDFKFTNVYRELDRGTVYLLDNILGKGKPVEDVFNIIVYRMFNRIETFEAIGYQTFPWKWQYAHRILRARQDAGFPLYTDAHMVCAYEHFPGHDKLARMGYILEGVYAGFAELIKAVRHSSSLGPIWKCMTQFPGIGPFLAYEMAVDISYANWNSLNEDEWVNPGPGCQRGLKFIFPNSKPNECQWLIKVLREHQKAEFGRLKLPFEAIAYKGKELTLRNIEHCLCEYFKWCKAMNGTGRPRNKFVVKAKVGNADFARLRG